MQALVNGPEGARSWIVRRAALDAVRGVERGMHEIDAVFDWVKRNIEFRGENGETLQSPQVTLQAGAGDCDCQSMLAAAMLKWLGYETRFRTVALRDSPSEFSHVYVEVRDKRTGEWVPLDTTVVRAYPGWQPEDVARTQSYPVMEPGAGGFSPLMIETLLTLGTLFLFARKA
jgi:transglutaminase-like putative cysteine protease